MRRLGYLGGMVWTVAFLSGCQQGKAPADVLSGVVPDSALAKVGLRYHWALPVQLSAGESVRQVWRLDENLYALTSRNRLIALDAAGGTYKWSLVVARPRQQVFPPCHADGVLVPETGGIAAILDPPDKLRLKPFNAVIVNSMTFALLINRDSGQVVRELDFDIPDSINTGGACDGTYLFLGSVKGRYYAIRLSEGLVQWIMAGGDMFTAAPRTFNKRLYVASLDGKFTAVNPDLMERRNLWSEQTDGPVSADFFVDARGCFVPSQDYRLYAYDTLTGGEIWTFRAQGPLRQGVQVGRQSCFQYADRDRFYAVDLATGRKRWDMPDGRQVLAVIGDKACVLTANRHLKMVDEMLGTTELSLPMTGLTIFLPNAAKPLIYAATGDGRFYCISQVGAGALTPELLRDGEAPPAPTPMPTSIPASLPASAPAE